MIEIIKGVYSRSLLNQDSHCCYLFWWAEIELRVLRSGMAITKTSIALDDWSHSLVHECRWGNVF